jgi:hypothetical protein
MAAPPTRKRSASDGHGCRAAGARHPTRRRARGCPRGQVPCSCPLQRATGDEDAPLAKRQGRLDEGAGVQPPQRCDEPPRLRLTPRLDRSPRPLPAVPAGEALGERGQRGVHPPVTAGPRGIRPHRYDDDGTLVITARLALEPAGSGVLSAIEHSQHLAAEQDRTPPCARLPRKTPGHDHRRDHGVRMRSRSGRAAAPCRRWCCSPQAACSKFTPASRRSRPTPLAWTHPQSCGWRRPSTPAFLWRPRTQPSVPRQKLVEKGLRCCRGSRRRSWSTRGAGSLFQVAIQARMPASRAWTILWAPRGRSLVVSCRGGARRPAPPGGARRAGSAMCPQSQRPLVSQR